MTTQSQPPAAPTEPIAPLILSLRDQRVILDADLARVYVVETRALNQAMKRNQDRFPADFMFDLAREEILRISQTVTSLRRLRFSKQVRAFTEHGALMAAMVCNVNQGLRTGADKVTKKHFKACNLDPRKYSRGEGIFILRRPELAKLSLTSYERKRILPLFKNSDVHKFASSDETMGRFRLRKSA